MRAFVPATPSGLFSAISTASFSAAATVAALLSCTADTNPWRSASAAPKIRAVNAMSLTHDSEPTILGRRVRVPISAAMPAGGR